MKEVNEECGIVECPVDFIYCPKRKMKLKMEEEKDEVLLTINFADYTMSLAPPCSLLSSSSMTPPSSLVSSSSMTPPSSLVSSSSLTLSSSLVSSSSLNLPSRLGLSSSLTPAAAGGHDIENLTKRLKADLPPGSSSSIPSGSDNCKTVSRDVIGDVLDTVSANLDSLKAQDEDLPLMEADPSTTIQSKLETGTLAKDQASLAMSSLDSVYSTGQSQVISDLTTLTGSVKVNSQLTTAQLSVSQKGLNTLVPTDQLLRYDQDATFTAPQEFGGEVTVAGDVGFDAEDVCEEITEDPYDITQDGDFYKLLWC